MSNYEIITDTGANLTCEQAEKYNIKIIGFPYLIDGKEHTDDPKNKTFETKELYSLLKTKTDVKTSLINTALMEEFFEPFLKNGKDIIYICLSGGISGTYQNSCICKNTLKKKYPDREIYTVDSLSGSYGQGLLAIKCAKKREAGLSLEEVFQYASELRFNINHDFTISDLFFLKRSGRLSGAGAILGTLAMIKPMFTLDNEGKIKIYAKANGRNKAISIMLDNFRKNIDTENSDIITVVHGDCSKDADYIVSEIKKEYPSSEILCDYLTPLVGAHTGPGAIGILYISKNKR